MRTLRPQTPQQGGHETMRTRRRLDVDTKTWVTEPGTYTLESGSSSDILPVSTAVRISRR